MGLRKVPTPCPDSDKPEAPPSPPHKTKTLQFKPINKTAEPSALTPTGVDDFDPLDPNQVLDAILELGVRITKLEKLSSKAPRPS